jgi:hypothetical protein
MLKAVGLKWIKQRVPEKIRNDWEKRKQEDLNRGGPDQPLIEYADFTDYLQIIVRADNWNDVFKPVFRRQENVRESFQRLFPIRLCTMHARIITQEDEIYLYAETMRISKAISVFGY